MAVLTGAIDCTGPVKPMIISLSGPTNTFFAISNNGPVPMGVTISGLGTEVIEPANSRAFFVPGGSAVEVEGPGCTGSWQFAVPG